jgi:hypothetical protein
MQQDRRIAQAELNTNLIAIFASRFSAGLENEAYLGMWSKLYATRAWKETELEIYLHAKFEAMRAVYETYYLEMPTEFTQTVNQLLAGQPSGNDS